MSAQNYQRLRSRPPLKLGDKVGCLTIERMVGSRVFARCDCGGSWKGCAGRFVRSKHCSRGCVAARKPLTGKRFGRLVVLRSTGKHGWWECQCDCGRVCQRKTADLERRGVEVPGVRSCGCAKVDRAPRKYALAGKRLGNVTVLRPVGAAWECRCDCGATFRRSTHYLVRHPVQWCRQCSFSRGAKQRTTTIEIHGVRLSPAEIARVAGLSSTYSVYGRLALGHTGAELLRPHRFAEHPELIGKSNRPPGGRHSPDTMARVAKMIAQGRATRAIHEGTGVSYGYINMLKARRREGARNNP